jgi:hypothetical protein
MSARDAAGSYLEGTPAVSVDLIGRVPLHAGLLLAVASQAAA